MVAIDKKKVVTKENPQKNNNIASLPSLIQVKNDREYIPLKVRARFSVPVEMLESPTHMERAYNAASAKFIHDIAKKGYHWKSGTSMVRGPIEDHLIYSEDCLPDPGPDGMPQVPIDKNPEAWEKYERAEKARLAAMVGEHLEKRDCTLITVCWKETKNDFHQAGKDYLIR